MRICVGYRVYVSFSFVQILEYIDGEGRCLRSFAIIKGKEYKYENSL